MNSLLQTHHAISLRAIGYLELSEAILFYIEDLTMRFFDILVICWLVLISLYLTNAAVKMFIDGLL